MLKDAYEIPLQVGDTVLFRDGCLYVIIDFIEYEVAVEALCEDKLSHELKYFQPRDLMKIEIRG